MRRVQLEPQVPQGLLELQARLVLRARRVLLGLLVLRARRVLLGLLVLQVQRGPQVLLEPLEQRGLQVLQVLQVQPRQARQE